MVVPGLPLEGQKNTAFGRKALPEKAAAPGKRAQKTSATGVRARSGPETTANCVYCDIGLVPWRARLLSREKKTPACPAGHTGAVKTDRIRVSFDFAGR